MPKMGVRTAVIASVEAGQFVWSLVGWRKGASRLASPVHRAKELGALLRYAMAGHGSTKRRTLVKVEELVESWIEAVVGMCLAHTKDDYDAHDAKADELLGPLLAAPIRQVREFYHRLLERMKTDKRVPMLVWMGFEAWGEIMVKNAPDEGIKRLKNKLAGEIADLVEEPLRDQIPGAVARALRWRDPETLEAVKKALVAGVKPKLRGRQSCLFMEMGRGKRQVSVML